MKKRLYISTLLLLITVAIQAAVTLTAKAPATVGVGEQFRLQYTVNSANVSNRPQLSSIPNFKVVYGPATSTSQSIQVINGHASQSATTTFTYTLIAEKEGSFTLPSITLSVDGQSFTSNKPRVSVVKGSGQSQSQAPSQQRGVPQQSVPANSSSAHSISPSDLYIEVSANKREVYEQEPLLLSYNVYTNLMLEQLQGKMPDLKGFVAKEIPLPRNKHLSIVRHNGRTTQTTTWSQYVMFPQQSGKLTVPSIPFEGTLVFPDRNIDPVDAFFLGSNALTRVNHTVNAPALDITVKPLPAKPEGFTGAVGRNFSVSAALATKQPRENEMFTLRVKIKGLGNIDLITPPEVQFPSDFETFDSKSDVKVELTTQGMEGELTIDYMAIPNHQGKFTIPPVKFIYFDPANGTYHTITSGESITVDVAKGNPNSYAARQRMKNDDIRHIHLGEIEASESSDFWLSPWMWLSYLLVIVAFVVCNVVIMSKQRNKQSGKSKSQGGKGALKSALALIGAEKKDLFYAEVLKTLQEFVADKTHLNYADINKDNIASLLSSYGVGEDTIKNYLDLVSECELHLYGVSDASEQEMQTTYNRAEEIISQLTPLLKKKRK